MTNVVYIERSRQSEMSRHWGPNYHDNLEAVKKIGQGGEGSAFLMRRTTDRKLLVCKVSHVYQKWKNTDNPREAKILREIVREHPRILKMLHFEITRRMEFMAFYDYCAGGDLREMMVVDHDGLYHGGTSARVLWHVFLQLAEALAFLHYGFTQLGIPPPAGWRHIVHCDLKVCSFILMRLVSSNGFQRNVYGDYFSTIFYSLGACRF